MNEFVVAAAQSASIRGKLDANIAAHLEFMRAAASVGVNLLIFPELSLTGYELDLADQMQLDEGDERLAPLHAAAKQYNMYVLVGAPWASHLNKPYLGAFLLGPEISAAYAKIHLAGNEQRYFAPGRTCCVVSVGVVPTGLAICADTRYADHPAEAAARGAALYVASVMQTKASYAAHADRLEQYAARHTMGVLTANYAGATGGFESAGGSAFWDQTGRLVARADSAGEALVVARQQADAWHGDIFVDPTVKLDG